MRRCCNLRCTNQIYGCMGTTKAGDYDEALRGIRTWREVRELCENCATKLILLCTGLSEMQAVYFEYFGWGQPLLPPPKPPA